MVSYQVRGNFEEFLVYGTKLAVIKRPDGRVTLPDSADLAGLVDWDRVARHAI